MTEAAVRSPAPPPRGAGPGRRLLIAAGVFLCVLLVLTALLYLNRRAATRQVLVGWLERQGIPADVDNCRKARSVQIESRPGADEEAAPHGGNEVPPTRSPERGCRARGKPYSKSAEASVFTLMRSRQTTITTDFRQ